MEFKVGDFIILDEINCDQPMLDLYGSSGEFGRKYKVMDIDRISGDVRLSGSNWHKEEWIRYASMIFIGGE